MGKKGVFAMTLQQQAHRLIDAMGEEELRAWILLIGKRDTHTENMSGEARSAEKRAALARLDQITARMAPRFPPDFDPEQELAAALEEKYGRLD